MLFFIIVVFAIEFKSALEYEKERSLKDHLTGAFNRRYFFETAKREIDRCRRYKHPFTLAFLDCDNLKSINDNMGHKTGDALLCNISEVMKAMLRNTDIVVRFGGDEFIIFMPETDHEASRKAIDRINKALLDSMKENGWDVTFSIGVITYISPPPESTDVVIIRADELLNAAKKGGKNSIRYAVSGSRPDH
jgi:diguanylate cyclase (GGDEF)-like protein